MLHIRANELLACLDSNFNYKQLFTKYQVLTKLPQISHIHKNRNFLKYNWDFLHQPLLPYKFHGSDMWGMYFFIFASCELLNGRERERGERQTGGDICVNKWQDNMLKKKILKHIARLDFVDIIKPTFLRNTISFMNRERRVIALVFTNKKTRSVCLSVCLSVRLYVSPCVDVSRWYFRYWSGTCF